MRRPAPLLGRRSVLLGSAAMTAAAASGCSSYNTVSDRQYGACRFDAEYLVAGSQENCWPATGTPTDLAWHLRKMNVPQAWAWSKDKGRASRGEGIVIGHVDTGVAEHEAFKAGGILWERGYDFIEKVHGGYDPLINHIEYLEQIGHGTATASVIVSRGEVEEWTPGKGKYRKDNAPPETEEEKTKREKKDAEYSNDTPAVCHGTGKPGRITGVSPAANLIPARAFRLAATRNLGIVTEAVNYLVDQRVDVITMALGWVFPDHGLTAAIQRAVKANILVLAAAGNFVPWVVFPANGGDAIAVAGLGPDDKPWCGGATGSAVMVSAYGDKVWRAYRDEKSNRQDVISPRFGTSFAVSMTAGVAALWLAHYGRDRLIADAERLRYPTLQSAFREALRHRSRKPDNWKKYNGALGFGIVDALALVKEEKPLAF